ncbi:MAG: hypothetical protein H0V83_01635 [Rubrobacter sp.]|nr:hypothetical protein [Rubrobacter sp.]
MIRLYAAGPKSVTTIENGKSRRSLEHEGARCLAVDPRDPDTVYVGTTDNGLFKSEDGGQSWGQLSGIVHPRITAVAVSPMDGAIYAGTEPSSLFVSRDGGKSWLELETMKQLPSAPTWSFPPRPWTSHVRSISPSHRDAALIVTGIELGGVLRSQDGGGTWQDQRPGAQPDCHSLATHPASPEAFFEAGGGGFAESADSGDTWTSAGTGFTLHYLWGLAVDAEDPNLVYASAARGPVQAHGSRPSEAAIYRRKDGERWEPVLENLDEFPYALAADPETSGSIYAGLGDGTILQSRNSGENWREIAGPSGGLDALAAVAV